MEEREEAEQHPGVVVAAPPRPPQQLQQQQQQQMQTLIGLPRPPQPVMLGAPPAPPMMMTLPIPQPPMPPMPPMPLVAPQVAPFMHHMSQMGGMALPQSIGGRPADPNAMMEEEPPFKRQRNEDQLMPEEAFLVCPKILCFMIWSK